MPETKTTIIETINIKKSYPTPAGLIMALKGINLIVQKGEFIGVIGRSGAGKTTLINILAGLDDVTEGEVWIKKEPIHKWTENQLARWRGRSIGIIYQNFQLLPSLSLLSNVALPIDFKGKFHLSNAKEKAKNKLEQVGLIEHIYKLPAEISGGQQQRVAIARALVNEPDLIFADEPTGRLDSTTAMVVFKIFEDLVAHGKTIVMVTHDKSLFSKFSRVIWMEDGKIASSNVGKNTT